METFLREVNAQLEALPPDERGVLFGRLLQLFRAVGVLRESLNFKGSLRMGVWLVEKSVAKTPPDRIKELVVKKAEELKLTHVIALIQAAAS